MIGIHVLHALREGAGVMFASFGVVGIGRTVYLEIAGATDRKTAQASLAFACAMLGIGAGLLL